MFYDMLTDSLMAFGAPLPYNGISSWKPLSLLDTPSQKTFSV